MSFKSIDTKADFPQLEEKLLKFWQENKIFEKVLEKRKNSKKFTFYDGPPFATGLPHYGHILAMSIKDAIVRLKLMQGFYVPVKLGWDCHGLPVEFEVEKELKISNKADIEKMGVGNFCKKCRGIVFRYTAEWKKTIERMGRFAGRDFYATLDANYIESVWWVFKQIWGKGLVYLGFKSMPYCPRCATPLSNFETNQGYQDNVPDPSIYVKFRLNSDPNTFLLAWTTTPWTLPGNAALAVNPKIDYLKVKTGNQYLILAKETQKLVGDFKKVEKVDIGEFIGQTYEPLYKISKEERLGKAYKIIVADFVSTEEGTGVVHIAPAFGEEDLEIGQKYNLPVFQTVDPFGKIISDSLPGAGKFVKDADAEIISDLKKRDLLFKSQTIYHTYPFCWRCETPLIYYAISTWFIKVSALRKKLVSTNSKIHWVPGHIKEGRFGKWLAEAKDWAVSRDRFWGAPVPIWICKLCQKQVCIGSLSELKGLALNPEKISDLHRPYIDKVKLKCDCGGEMSRVLQVLDCWFESGSMPYAHEHFPFENKTDFEKSFPADFIAEGLDQTRGWFYTLHVIATILFSQPAFKNCIVNGLVLDEQGRKLSKRLRNYPEPEEIFLEFGADSLRFLLLSSAAVVGENLLFSKEPVAQIYRKVILILWNVYNFFVTYANIDDFKPTKLTSEALLEEKSNILDKWILLRLDSTIEKASQSLDGYYLLPALRQISNFITDLSTWYIRRSRDRVGPTVEAGADKNNCHATLYYILVNLAKILAPFTPFISDEIYKNLTSKPSVHLSDWPKVNLSFVDEKLEKEMETVRKLAEVGHGERKAKNLKVRQPLASLTYYFENKLSKESEEILADELNVKKVNFKKAVPAVRLPVGQGRQGKLKIKLDTKLTDKLLAEGEARESVRKIQQERKSLGCSLSEFVEVVLPNWPVEFKEYIARETLASKVSKGSQFKVIRQK